MLMMGLQLTAFETFVISALISEISGMVDLKIEFLFSCQVILQDRLQLGSGCKSYRNLRYKDYIPLGSLEKSSLLDLGNQ